MRQTLYVLDAWFRDIAWRSPQNTAAPCPTCRRWRRRPLTDARRHVTTSTNRPRSCRPEPPDVSMVPRPPHPVAVTAVLASDEQTPSVGDASRPERQCPRVGLDFRRGRGPQCDGARLVTVGSGDGVRRCSSSQARMPKDDGGHKRGRRKDGRSADSWWCPAGLNTTKNSCRQPLPPPPLPPSSLSTLLLDSLSSTFPFHDWQNVRSLRLWTTVKNWALARC